MACAGTAVFFCVGCYENHIWAQTHSGQAFLPRKHGQAMAAAPPAQRRGSAIISLYACGAWLDCYLF